MKKKIVLPAILITLAAALFVAFLVPITIGQQERPKPGSPADTESLNSKALPAPPPKFGGEIKPSAAESRPWWPPRAVPPRVRPTCC